MTTTADIDRTREALQFIDSSDRDTWVRMGMAIKSEFGDPGFELWEPWSMQADSFNSNDARSTWKSISLEGGVSIGTLFFEAKNNGWRDEGARRKPTPEEFADWKRKAAERAKKEEVALVRERAGTAKRADEVWNAATEAKADHPYLSRKQILPTATLREIDAGEAAAILGYSPQSSGDLLTGRLLVVPVKQGDALSTLELIDGDKRKTALAGRGSKAGGYWASDRLPDGDGSGQTLLIGEGMATVLSASEATGHPAIAALSSSNLPAVAKAMRDRYRAAELVILADLVKETGEPDPHAIKAAIVGAGRTAIPDFGTDRDPDMTDMNDLYIRCGADAVEQAISGAIAPAGSVADRQTDLSVAANDADHPLMRFVELSRNPAPPRWILPGFIAEEVLLVAGEHGAGKTSVFVPLALTVCGLGGRTDLHPKEWRHVVYVTEDAAQVQRIVSAFCDHFREDFDHAKERFHLVTTQRLPPANVVRVGARYAEQFTRTIKGIALPPLVIFDTKSATFAAENENDNAEASEAVAALKQDFAGLPAWIITHVAKGADGKPTSSRGASAWDADVNGTAFLEVTKSERRLCLGKVRFAPRWYKLPLASHCQDFEVKNEWGEPEALKVFFALPDLAANDDDVTEAEKQAADAAAMRLQIHKAVSDAHAAGLPLPRSAVSARIGRNKQATVDAITQGITECWLYEVEVPKEQRVNVNKRAFLIALDFRETEDVKAGKPLPPDRLAIPPSWRKPAIPSAPEAEPESGNTTDDDMPASDEGDAIPSAPKPSAP